MWYLQHRWRSRLVAEAAVMGDRFPGFRLRVDGSASLFWVGVLTPLSDTEFVVAVVYPADYPYRAPSLWILEPDLTSGVPHMYPDGSICIHANNWDPERGTAVSCVTLIAGWLVAYVNWQRTGEAY